jgi:hypothetical protein
VRLHSPAASTAEFDRRALMTRITTRTERTGPFRRTC